MALPAARQAIAAPALGFLLIAACAALLLSVQYGGGAAEPTPSDLPTHQSSARAHVPAATVLADRGAAGLVFMHGLGGSGANAEGLTRRLQAMRPQQHLIIDRPDAPTRPTTLTGGRMQRAWFDMDHLPLTEGATEDIAGFNASAAFIHARIDAIVRGGIPAHRIVLGGFSQGGALTLYAGLRYPVPLAGLLVLGGWAVAASELSSCMTQAVASSPPHILIGHGTEDATIPFSFATEMRSALLERHFNVTWHTFHGGHTVSASLLEAISDFMDVVLH